MLVKDACAEAGISRDTLHRWTTDAKDLSDAYARARENQAHAWAEKAIVVADGDDDLTNARIEAIDQHETELVQQGMTADEASRKVAPLYSNAISRDKLRVDTYKWMASKLAPKAYGDRIQQDVTLEISDRAEVMKAARERAAKR